VFDATRIKEARYRLVIYNQDYEIGESELGAFMATEFVDGQTLREAIKSKSLSIIQILKIFDSRCEQGRELAVKQVSRGPGVHHRSEMKNL
jgi:hypothetical protein